MLIVSDYVRQAKNNGIPVGPGRGSVGGSLVAHLLDIHDVNPLQYGLLFERFHNKEKSSFPDIDSDFSPDGKDWVENYITNKYGKEKVAHVSNLNRMTPKVVIKDVAKSLELGGTKSNAFQIANKITDSIPDDPNITFDKAYNKSEEFRKWCEKYPELEKYGRKLTGLEKAYSTHAAGVVIGDIDLSTYIPLRIDKKGAVAVQYEKERCETLGLIKMDLLGLEHLRIINNTIRNAKQLGHNPLQSSQLAPFDDQNVWDLISKGNTSCVFQMGSPHMRALCRKIKPQNIEDLSLVNALGRPSAAESRAIYIARRDGKQKITYELDCLEPALKDTLGVCVYEEQLAKLAFYVAGWDLNKADGLRKFTKLKGKKPELAAQLKEDFIMDAMSYSKLKKEEAMYVWEDIIEPFARYGFNKAHGIFYSLNGYHTAYYKYHYPAPFMAAVLEAEVNKPSSTTRDNNLRIYKKEAKKLMGIKIKVPDINKSGANYTVLDDKTIVTGLAAVKGVGAKAIDEIIRVRNQYPFMSFADFLLRTSSTLVRKNVIQALAKAGCFDSLDVTRKNAYDNYDVYRKAANSHHKKVSNEGRNAWNILDDFIVPDKINKQDEWDIKTKLHGEQEVLGEYVSGDINDMFNNFFTGKSVTSLRKLKKLANGDSIRTEAVITALKQEKLKKGKNAGKHYGKCVITDTEGHSTSMTIWPEQLKRTKEYINIGRAIRAICKVNWYQGSPSLVLERLEDTAGV